MIVREDNFCRCSKIQKKRYKNSKLFGHFTNMSYLCTEHLGRAYKCSPRAVRRSKNWFRATDGLSGHEFTVGAAPLAALSRLFAASSPN